MGANYQLIEINDIPFIERDANNLMIIIICGLPGVGKTTVAKNLASLVNAVILYIHR